MGEFGVGLLLSGLFAIIGAIIFYYLSGKNEIAISSGIMIGGSFGMLIWILPMIL